VTVYRQAEGCKGQKPRQASKQLDLQERLERANLKIIKMEKTAMELETKNDKLKHVLEANRITNKKIVN